MCGLFGVAAGLQGYLFHKINWVLRIIVVAAGVLIMIPISSANEMYSILINVGGFAIIAAITLIQRQLGKKHAAQLADGTANTDAKDVEGASEADTKKLND